MNNFRGNHHYVSQSYLKAWGNKHKRIWTYNTLVSHENVPVWSQAAIKNIANHFHLFTRNMEGSDSDEIEKWMEREIETPAQNALDRIRSVDSSLSSEEWDRLLRYVALHDVRNPARYVDHIKRWKSEMPGIMENVLKSVVREMGLKRAEGTHKSQPFQDSELIPLKVTKEINPNSDQGYLRAEVILGRGLWFFSIRHLLTSTYKTLGNHKWSIIEAPEDKHWLTSDNPVVRVNYYKPGFYDLKGGWGNKGSEILFPLSPKLLLYTQVGSKKKQTYITNEQAAIMNKCIAENAYRYVFAEDPIADIGSLAERIVDRDAFIREKEEWDNWHVRQKILEKELKVT